MSERGIKLQDVSVVLDGSQVLDRVSLIAARGEMLVVAGPSGCGKSTLLRAIAGLLPTSTGSIFGNGQVLDGRSPGRRNLAMVFQHHALLPHLNVAENLEFGLRARGMARKTARSKAAAMAESMGLQDLLERRPADLSGGECQRIALGRALLREAPLILMDEPLSSLDGPLRARLRGEIMALHARLESTIVFVTHDQTEALGMADRLAVMNAGKILQVGPPEEIYSDPDSLFVARFIGHSPINVLRPTDQQNGRAACLGVVLNGPQPPNSMVLAIRPEEVAVEGSRWATAIDGPAVEAKLIRCEPLGDAQLLHLSADDQRLSARVEPGFSPSNKMRIRLNAGRLLRFDANSGKRLR